MVDIRIDKL